MFSGLLLLFNVYTSFKYKFKKRTFRIEKMERYFRKAEAQVYVIGTRGPTMFLQETYIGSLCRTFQVRFIFDVD